MDTIHLSRNLAVACLLLTAPTSAIAADFGGSCCADLEERVAELEATVVRKGNRKVSLELSGHVNEAILFWDDGVESNIYVGEPNNSRTRFRLRGSAKINAEWSAGFLVEFGFRQQDLGNSSQSNVTPATGPDVRHQAVSFRSKTYGTIWLGQTGSAAEGITEINAAGTLETAFPIISYQGLNLRTNGTGALSGVTLTQAAGVQGEFKQGEGNRRNIISYTSPTFSGFSFAAAWGGDDFADVALRYRNEFNGIRIWGGIGYQWSTDEGDAGQFDNCTTTGGNGIDCEALGLSASVLHVASGLYVAGSYGYNLDNNKANNDRDEHYLISAGIKRKWSPLGETNIFGQYGESEAEIARTSRVDLWGIGINQKIDAAASEIYVTYHRVDAESVTDNAALDLDVVLVGTRIRF